MGNIATSVDEQIKKLLENNPKFKTPIIKNKIIYTLTNNFESHSNQTKDETGFWLARDLQYILGYTKWDNFIGVISKAKTACKISGENIENHFAGVGKMVSIGSGVEKEIQKRIKSFWISRNYHIKVK